MDADRVYVSCYSRCWSGYRVPGDCAHYDEWALYCDCPFGKGACGHKLHPVRWINEMKKSDKKTEEFWKKHKFEDGKIVAVEAADGR